MARDMTTAASKSPELDAERTVEISPRTFYVGLGVMVACLAGAFFYFLVSQVEYAIDSPDDWGHTLLVPAIAGWLIFRDRTKIAALIPRPTEKNISTELTKNRWSSVITSTA